MKKKNLKRVRNVIDVFRYTLRSVYEYLKPLRDEKLMKCLRNVKIFCSHFFNASQVYIFHQGTAA